jgi:hypothetical protein
MKKLTTSALALLLLMPCVCHSMESDQENERDIRKSVKTDPLKTPNSPPGLKRQRGKFMGTDKKRDVAIYQEFSNDSFSTRLGKVIRSWGRQAPSNSIEQTTK